MDSSSKRLKLSEVFAETLFSQDFIDNTQKRFQENTPFPHDIVHNIFDEEFLKQVKEELLGQEFVQKSNDLYQFQQTKLDIRSMESPALKQLTAELYGTRFRDWLKKTTGITVKEQADLSGFRYPNTSYLLCHDDVVAHNTTGRKIAFIIYLVEPDWSKADGGELVLYDSKDGQPFNEVKRSVPSWNSFLFFQVKANTSYHEVAEVTSTKERVSIGGWFHGELDPVDLPAIQASYQQLLAKLRPKSTPFVAVGESLENLLAPVWLKEQNRVGVRRQFEQTGQIVLPQFLSKEFFLALKLEIEQSNWSLRQPCNVHRYFTTDGLTENMAKLRKLFTSTWFCKYLNQLTGLELTESAHTYRNFRPGCYTLMHDQQHDRDHLEVLLYFSGHDWSDEGGGNTIFTDGDDILADVSPEENSISLVLSSQSLMSCCKFLNHTATDQIYDLQSLYYEDDAPK